MIHMDEIPADEMPEHLGWSTDELLADRDRQQAFRLAYPISLAAGATWPASDNGFNMPPWRFMRIDHRGGGDVAIHPTMIPRAGDSTTWWDYITSGSKVTKNALTDHGGELPKSLYITNVGTTTATLLLEVSNTAIVDSRAGAATGANGGFSAGNSTLVAQTTSRTQVQTGATADGNGLSANVDGYNGFQYVEVQKTGTGTVNLNIEGSDDGGVTWYLAGYYQVDGVAALSRAASAVAIGAGGVNHVYQVLDAYKLLRARLQGTVGVISVNAWIYAIPV